MSLKQPNEVVEFWFYPLLKPRRGYIFLRLDLHIFMCFHKNTIPLIACVLHSISLNTIKYKRNHIAQSFSCQACSSDKDLSVVQVAALTSLMFYSISAQLLFIMFFLLFFIPSISQDNTQPPAAQTHHLDRALNQRGEKKQSDRQSHP